MVCQDENKGVVVFGERLLPEAEFQAANGDVPLSQMLRLGLCRQTTFPCSAMLAKPPWRLYFLSHRPLVTPFHLTTVRRTPPRCSMSSSSTLQDRPSTEEQQQQRKSSTPGVQSGPPPPFNNDVDSTFKPLGPTKTSTPTVITSQFYFEFRKR